MFPLTSPFATGSSSSRSALSTAVLSVGFALTGAGTVLLGVLLPVFAEKWGLRDDDAGLLLLLQFGGSSLGAILSGLNRVRSMAIGYGLMAAGAFDPRFLRTRTHHLRCSFSSGLGWGWP